MSLAIPMVSVVAATKSLATLAIISVVVVMMDAVAMGVMVVVVMMLWYPYEERSNELFYLDLGSVLERFRPRSLSSYGFL